MSGAGVEGVGGFGLNGRGGEDGAVSVVLG